MVLCGGSGDGAKCGALQVCPTCETCDEHCSLGNSGACVDAQDNWLAGGPGGMVEIAGILNQQGHPPFNAAHTRHMKLSLFLAQDQLMTENRLCRCGGCGGLEDSARPHKHG